MPLASDPNISPRASTVPVDVCPDFQKDWTTTLYLSPAITNVGEGYKEEVDAHFKEGQKGGGREGVERNEPDCAT